MDEKLKGYTPRILALILGILLVFMEWFYVGWTTVYQFEAYPHAKDTQLLLENTFFGLGLVTQITLASVKLKDTSTRYILQLLLFLLLLNVHKGILEYIYRTNNPDIPMTSFLISQIGIVVLLTVLIGFLLRKWIKLPLFNNTQQSHLP